MKMRTTLGLAAVVGRLLLLPIAGDAAGAPAPRETKASFDNMPLQLDSLPFSIRHLRVYFDEAFGKRPSKIEGKRFVYADRENPDEIVVIAVAELDANLGVVLLATGDYGLNYIREFFEAPFFLRQETEQLYMLLEQGPGIRSVALKRFHVEASICTAGRWLCIALEFRPSQLSRAQPILLTRGPGEGSRPRL